MTRTTNAKRSLRFDITPRDIKFARRKDPHNCAAARALKRQLGADDVSVHASRVIVEKAGKITKYKTPLSLRVETVALDRGGKFAPGPYELQPIPPSHTPAGLRRYRARKVKAAKPSKPRHRRATPNVRPRA